MIATVRSPDVILQLHRAVVGLAPGQKVIDRGRWGDPIVLQIDHRDGNKLNCQRSNLRLTTPAGNSANRWSLIPGGSSRYRGVTWHAGRGSGRRR